jgi:hypothetical protein
MRTFLLGLVCFLVSFVSADSIYSARGRSTVLAAPPLQVGQCPPCVDPCYAMGVTVNGNVQYNASCTFNQETGNVCHGHGDIFLLYGLTVGRDELKNVQAQCAGTNDATPPASCTGTVNSYEVVSNVCCTVGQSQPHYTCDNGAGGRGTCVYHDYCGTTNCQNPDQNCGCVQGLYKSHTECWFGACLDVDTCGHSECLLDGDCNLPEGRQYNNCNDGIDNDGDGDTDYDDEDCLTSPIVVDVAGNGFHLSGLADPVLFDFDGNGRPLTMGWTARSQDDAFLVLDRNGNGTIDNGAELFGNLTPQPQSPNRNGFAALREYDKPQNGGNGDGFIGSQDAIFSSLRLWQDMNHNGFSEPGELHTLAELGVALISLDFRQSERRDQNGNRFRFRARVYNAQGAHLGRWAYDVFLVFRH